MQTMLPVGTKVYRAESEQGVKVYVAIAPDGTPCIHFVGDKCPGFEKCKLVREVCNTDI